MSVGLDLSDLDNILLGLVVEVFLTLDLLESNFLHGDPWVFDAQPFLLLFDNTLDFCKLLPDEFWLDPMGVIEINALFENVLGLVGIHPSQEPLNNYINLSLRIALKIYFQRIPTIFACDSS